MDIEQLKDGLINLKIVLEEIEKIDIKESTITKNVKKNKNESAERVKIKKNRWIKRVRKKINVAAIKNKFSERPDNIKEELKLRKTTRKNINEIEKLETEIKEMKNIKTVMIEYKSHKLLVDLNMEKGILKQKK